MKINSNSPGVARMSHYVHTKNIPASLDEIKAMTAVCKTCAICKPRFFKPPDMNLVKATQPFVRISLDLFHQLVEISIF